jgi:hypothetical protein
MYPERFLVIELRAASRQRRNLAIGPAVNVVVVLE